VGCPGASCPLTSNFQENTRFLKHNTSFDVKVDHNFNDRDRMSFRFSRALQNVNELTVFGLAGLARLTKTGSRALARNISRAAR
jgi:hypothetical protein